MPTDREVGRVGRPEAARPAIRAQTDHDRGEGSSGSGHGGTGAAPNAAARVAPTTEPNPTRPGHDHDQSALAARLRAAGQRVTPQRLAILAAVAPGEHRSADEIFARVAPALPGVNRSTVFRTLERFRDLGLVSETDLGGGARRFELLGSRHHHLVCHRCGRLLELDDALVRPLRDAIRDRYGFAAAVDHLALFGHCAACAPHPDQPPT